MAGRRNKQGQQVIQGTIELNSQEGGSEEDQSCKIEIEFIMCL